jgi:hypothetical protein
MPDIEKLTSDVYAVGKTFGEGATKKVTPTLVAAIEELKASISPDQLDNAVNKLRDAFYQGTLVGGLGLDPGDAKDELASAKLRPPDVTRLLNVAKVLWSRARIEAGLPKKRATTHKHEDGGKPDLFDSSVAEEEPETVAEEEPETEAEMEASRPVFWPMEITFNNFTKLMRTFGAPSLKDAEEAETFVSLVVDAFSRTYERNSTTISTDSVFMRVFDAMRNAVKVETETV